MLSSLEFHKDFLEYRVSTHEIGVYGFDLTSDLSATALSALLFEPNNSTFSWRSASDAHLRFHIERENDRCFVVSGAASMVLICSCVRCIKPVSCKIALNFTIRMLQKEHFDPKATDADFQFDSFEIDMDAEENTEVGYFSDKCIDLGIILRDQIYLAVPDYPQCGDDVGSKSKSCAQEFLGMINSKDAIASSNPFIKLLGKK